MHTLLKMGAPGEVIPLGYSDFVAIETFDVVTRIQGFHGTVPLHSVMSL